MNKINNILRIKAIFPYSILICFGVIFISLTCPKQVAAATSATVISQNFISGSTSSPITSVVYNLSSLPSGTGATIQFSTDGTNWYNRSAAAGSETMTLGTNNTIALSNYSGTSFYYKLVLTGDGTTTPVVDDITVIKNNAGNDAYTSGSTATYTVQSNLTANTTYYMRAYAIDPAGSAAWSNASSTISFTPGNLVVPPLCQANLVYNIGPIQVTWTDSSNIEDNYLLEVSVNGGGFAQVASLAPNTTSSTQSISPTTNYQYRIRAVAGGSQYTSYCTTVTVTSYAASSFRFEKVGLEKIQIQ